MHICQFAHDDPVLESDFRELLEDRLFEFFYQGRSLPEGAADYLGEHESTPVADAIAAILKRLARTATFAEYTAGNATVSEKAAHDAVAWCSNRLLQTEENRHLREIAALESDAEASVPEHDTPPRVLLTTAETLLTRAVETLGPNDEFAFLAGRVRATCAEAAGGHRRAARAEAAAQASNAAGPNQSGFPPQLRQTARTLALAVAREVARRSRERHRALLESAFAESFPAFVTELATLLPRLAKLQSRLEDFLGAGDRLWDRETRKWQAVEWDVLEAVAGELAEEPSLLRLANILGRMASTATTGTEQLVPVSRVSRESVSLGRSEVDGIENGRRIDAVLAEDLALLADPDTTDLFDKRFADSELTVRSYKTREERDVTSVHYEARSVAIPTDAGPVILCIDTSGSMAGEPERVAKLTTLAVTKIAVASARSCYLIFFSSQIHTIEVSDVGATIEELVSFLHGAVRGGTDLVPALRHATILLANDRYTNADVLVISDFRIPKIPAGLRDAIAAEQSERGSRFHSLTVTDKPVRDPMHLFDYRWHYDTSNPLSQGIPPEAFHLLT